MAKKKNSTRLSSTGTSNWDKYSSNRGQVISTAEGSSISNSRLIQGVAYLQADRTLKISIFYKSEAGYDPITNVLNDSFKHTLTFDEATCSKSSVTLAYKNFKKSKSSILPLKIQFASGVIASINLTVPGLNSHLTKNVSEVTSVLTDSPYENSLTVSLDEVSGSHRILTRLNSISDPYKVFGYPGIINQTSPFVYSLNSESLNESFVDAGVQSSNSNVDNGISTRGVGSLFGGSKKQEIHFTSLLTINDIEDVKEFSSRINDTTFISGFIYSENLYDLPDDAPTFYVCLNEAESSYYRTSELDCDGETIGSTYISGNKPARFVDGQCCNTLCDDFSISVENTSPLDAFENNDTRGSIKITVSGGTSDFRYTVGHTSETTPSTVITPDREYEFTGLTLFTGEQEPLKITVTDANGCVKQVWMHLNKNARETVGLISGCTDTGAINYDAGADVNSGCIYCTTTGARGENAYNLSMGTSAANSRSLGLELFQDNKSRVQHATTSAASDGIIYINVDVFPDALSSFKEDSDAVYRFRRYDLGTGEGVNNLTKAEILATGADASTTKAFTVHKFSGLAPGWYAIAVDISNLPSVTNCISIFRFKVEHGGCTDPLASNYDRDAVYNSGGCTYECPEATETITIGNTKEPCIKTVSVSTQRENETINWTIGNKPFSGAGPHLAKAEDYVVVTRENSRTGCSSSEETYIDATDCNIDETIEHFTAVTARSWGIPDMTDSNDSLYTMWFDSTILMNLSNTGGCTDPNAFNYDCNALYDNGSCIEPIFGCTDQLAINFEPEANVDDGSCFIGVVGCCDPSYSDYNPLANICEPCTANLLGDAKLVGMKISQLGPPCPASMATMDVWARSNTMTIDTWAFNAPNFNSIRIPAGMTIKAYPIPTAGLPIAGKTINELILPLEEFGWKCDATWKITGEGRVTLSGVDNLNQLSFTAEDEIYGSAIVWPTEEPLVGNYMTDMVATEGDIGYGAYILEVKIPNAAGGYHYGWGYFNSPHDGSTIGGGGCSIVVANVGTEGEGGGGAVVGCTDPTAANYNPQASLTPYIAKKMGYGGHIAMGINQISSSVTLPPMNLAELVSWEPFGTNLTPNPLLNPVLEEVSQCYHAPHYINEGINHEKHCVPNRIHRQIRHIKKCINNGSVNWFNNLITGRNTKKEEKDLFIMNMIAYLLEHGQGLECIFNCSDRATPDLEYPITCEELWKAGGESRFTFDATTGLSTTLLQGNQLWKMDFKDQEVLPWMGDTAPNTYWYPMRIIPDPMVSPPGFTKQPYGDTQKVGFRQCIDTYKKITETTNYLDFFFKFAHEYCESCGPCVYNARNKNSFISMSPKNIITDSGVSESTSLTVGGLSLSFGGETLT